jgi:hypothetical protein
MSSFLAYTGKLTDEQYNEFMDLWYELSLSRHCILSRENNVVHIYTIQINLYFIVASFEDGLLSHNGWSKFFLQEPEKVSLKHPNVQHRNKSKTGGSMLKFEKDDIDELVKSSSEIIVQDGYVEKRIKERADVKNQLEKIRNIKSNSVVMGMNDPTGFST